MSRISTQADCAKESRKSLPAVAGPPPEAGATPAGVSARTVALGGATAITDSPLAASLATLAAFVGSQVLDLISATQSIQPYLPTHYWLKFVDFYRDPIPWRDIVRGIGLQVVYVGVFLGAAWANFTTKDVTS